MQLYALGSVETSFPNAQSGVMIHVARPNLPAYLDGKRLQYRAEDGEVKAVSRARWAETLEEGVSRAIAESLMAAREGLVISYYPWPDRSKSDKDLHINIYKLGVRESGEIGMAAAWELKTRSGVIDSGVFESTGVSWVVGQPESYVAALNAALLQLAESLSTAL